MDKKSVPDLHQLLHDYNKYRNIGAYDLVNVYFTRIEISRDIQSREFPFFVVPGKINCLETLLTLCHSSKQLLDHPYRVECRI